VIITFGQQIRTVRELLADEDEDYARAIALFLDFVLMKLVGYNSKRCLVAAWWPQDRPKP